MATRTVAVNLVANIGSYVSQLGRASAATRTLGTTAQSSFASVGKGAALLGGVVAVGLGMAVKSALDFEKSMRNVNSLLGLSQAGFQSLSGEVLALADRLPLSAQTLADGLYEIASSGFDGAEGLEILEKSAVAATAGLTDTETAAGAITAVLNAYGRGAEDAADVSDVLFSTVNYGVITFEELANSIGDTVGTAAAAKVGIEDVGAAIATMTLTGISGAESTTSLNRVLQSLIDPSEALAGELANLGYESGAQALETDGLRVVMDKLRTSTGGNITALLELFPEIRAARGALALMSDEGENYARVAGEMEDESARAGATAEVFAEQMKATANQAALVGSSLEVVGIQVGTALLPVLGKLIDGFGSAFAAGRELAAEVGERLAPFFGSAAEVGADLWEILDSIGDVVGPIASGMAKIAGAAILESLNLLGDVLSAVTGFLADNTDLALALATVLTVQLAGGITAVTIAFNRFLLTPVVLGVMGMIGALGSLTTALSVARVAAVRLVTALAPLAVLTVAVQAVREIINFGNAGDDARESIEGLKESLEGIEGNAARFEANTAAIAQMRREMEGFQEFAADVADQNWFDKWVWKNPFGSEDKDAKNARESVKAYEAALDDLVLANARASESTAILGAAFKMSEGEVQALADKYGIDLTGAVYESIRLFENYRAMELGDAKAVKTQELIDALGTLADEASTATERVDALKTALDLLGGKQVSVFEATSALQQVVASATGAMKDLEGSVLDANGGLNAYSESGQKAGEILIGVRDRGNDLITTLIEQGATLDEVRAADAELRRSFIDSATQMGISREAAERLADEILGVPEERETRFEAAISGAQAKIDQLQREIDALKGKTVEIQVRAAGRFVISPTGGLQEFAEGGWTGPGSKYTPAGIVHADEFVVPKRRVNELGGPNAVGALVGMPGYADGGRVLPINVVHDTRSVELAMEQVANAMKNAAPKGLPGVPAGGGSLGGSYQTLFAAIKTAFPQARLNSGYRAGDPGYHGRGKAADIGLMGVPGGAGNAFLARVDQWLYDNHRGSLAELIYTGAGDSRPDLKNSRPLNYGAATNAQHRNHVHAAVYDQGGWLQPGLTMAYNGTGSPERVLTSREFSGGGGVGGAGGGSGGAGGGSGGAANVTVQARVFIGSREITDIARVEATAVVAQRDAVLARNARSAR